MFSEFTWQQFWGAFFVLFAIIDIPGAIPLIISMRKRGKIIKPLKASILAFIMFIIFYFVGEAFLNLFGVDIPSFAVAGSLIIFVLSSEMILDIAIFKDTSDTPKDSSFFPVVFPLIAGAGSLTTILAIRSQFAEINILIAILANMFVVYAVLRLTSKIEKVLGAGMLYMLKKFFGIILLAISIKLFTTNVTLLVGKFIKVTEELHIID